MIDEVGAVLGVAGAVLDDVASRVGAYLDRMTLREAGGIAAALVAWCASVTLAGTIRRTLRLRRRGDLPNPRGKRWG